MSAQEICPYCEKWRKDIGWRAVKLRQIYDAMSTNSYYCRYFRDVDIFYLLDAYLDHKEVIQVVKLAGMMPCLNSRLRRQFGTDFPEVDLIDSDITRGRYVTVAKYLMNLNRKAMYLREQELQKEHVAFLYSFLP